MTFVREKNPVKVYRRAAIITSFVALALAFASKYYAGPYRHFSDAYLGDVFIVICLYYWLASAFPPLPILAKFSAIAVLACAVEFVQLSGWPARLDLPEPFVFILGTSFDPKDFLFYAIGLCLAVLVDGRLYVLSGRR